MFFNLSLHLITFAIHFKLSILKEKLFHFESEEKSWLIGQQMITFASYFSFKINWLSCNINNNEGKNLFLAGIKDTLFFQVHRIHMTMYRLANKYLVEEKFPIRSEQFPVLITIHTYPGISQQEIADLTNRDKSSVQRTILSLSKKGLVSIQQDQKDKRKNRVSTTQEGDNISVRLGEIIQKVEKEISEIFNAELTKDHIHSLNVIADNLEQLHKI